MTAHPETTPSSPRRILCVEDEPAVREVLALHLRRQAYEVETAPDGLTAWQRVANDFARFDVIITDNQMPQLSGIDLVAKLREGGYRGKIIFFSSTLPPHSAERLERLRVDAVLEKGRPVSELITAVARALSPGPDS